MNQNNSPIPRELACQVKARERPAVKVLLALVFSQMFLQQILIQTSHFHLQDMDKTSLLPPSSIPVQTVLLVGAVGQAQSTAAAPMQGLERWK